MLAGARAARRKRPSDSQSPHGVYLSEEKSDNIVKRLKAKKSQESIAKELKCSLKAVKRRAAKLKQKGEYARTPQGGKWRGSSRKRFAKEAKDSDKVNEEGDKANEGPSPKRKKLTDKERGAIEYGLTRKDSPALIGAILGRHPRTVKKCAQRLRQRGTLDRKPGSGRPRKTDARMERRIFREEKKDAQISVSDIHRDDINTDDFDISVQTLRTRYHEIGLPGRRLAHKPFLTERHIAARLEWAQTYESWTAEDWRRVVWSDETGFRLWQSRGPQYVRRAKGDRYNPKKLVSTVKHGGGVVMAWGCLSIHGVGPLYRLKETMTGKIYHQILSKKAIPHVFELIRNHRDVRPWVFVQDNDPKHGAKVNKNYLKKKVADAKGALVLMQWPSQSPDLNPRTTSLEL